MSKKETERERERERQRLWETIGGSRSKRERNREGNIHQCCAPVLFSLLSLSLLSALCTALLCQGLRWRRCAAVSNGSALIRAWRRDPWRDPWDESAPVPGVQIGVLPASASGSVLFTLPRGGPLPLCLHGNPLWLEPKKWNVRLSARPRFPHNSVSKIVWAINVSVLGFCYLIPSCITLKAQT